MAKEMARCDRSWSVELTDEESRTLYRLSDSYATAELLIYWCTEWTEDDPDDYTSVVTLNEDTAAEYRRQLRWENNDPAQRVPTCVGGTLKEKLDGLLTMVDRAAPYLVGE